MRHKREPTLNDIYVEGDFDKRVLDKGYKYLGEHRPVYNVDTIDIPSSLLESLGLTDGNKQRVVALCMSACLPDDARACFMVDRDLDYALGKELKLFGLKYTKYCDLEGSFLSPEIVEELIVIAGRSKIPDWPTLHASIEQVVRSMFAVRLSVFEISPSIRLIDFTKCLSCAESSISLNVVDLVSRSCHVPGRVKILEKLNERIEQWTATLNKVDIRHCMRGHDYISTISWVIRKFKGQASVADAIEDILILLVPRVTSDLLEPMES